MPSAHHQPAGELQFAVQPGVQQRPAVDLDAGLQPAELARGGLGLELEDGESVWAPRMRNTGDGGRTVRGRPPRWPVPTADRGTAAPGRAPPSGIRQAMTAPSRTSTYPPGSAGKSSRSSTRASRPPAGGGPPRRRHGSSRGWPARSRPGPAGGGSAGRAPAGWLWRVGVRCGHAPTVLAVAPLARPHPVLPRVRCGPAGPGGLAWARTSQGRGRGRRRREPPSGSSTGSPVGLGWRRSPACSRRAAAATWPSPGRSLPFEPDPPARQRGPHRVLPGVRPSAPPRAP